MVKRAEEDNIRTQSNSLLPFIIDNLILCVCNTILELSAYQWEALMNHAILLRMHFCTVLYVAPG